VAEGQTIKSRVSRCLAAAASGTGAGSGLCARNGRQLCANRAASRERRRAGLAAGFGDRSSRVADGKSLRCGHIMG